MARIRTVKPEFFSDRRLLEICGGYANTRVYEALWCLADDEGRLLDSPAQVEAFAYPYDDYPHDPVRPLLEKLSTAGRIIRYTSPKGEPLIQICHWEHQRLDHPKQSKWPGPPREAYVKAGVTKARQSRSHPAKLRDASRKAAGAIPQNRGPGKGTGEGEGEEVPLSLPRPSGTPSPSPGKAGSQMPEKPRPPPLEELDGWQFEVWHRAVGLLGEEFARKVLWQPLLADPDRVNTVLRDLLHSPDVESQERWVIAALKPPQVLQMARGP